MMHIEKISNVTMIQNFVKQNPNLYYRFEEDYLAESSIEDGKYNDAYTILRDEYQEMGKERFEELYPYFYNEKQDLFEAKGVNALKGELIEECWMSRYSYNLIYAFEAEEIGENVAGDGLVVKVNKIIKIFDLDELKITIDECGSLIEER